ncbi:MAG TPA: DUF2865 domain-containing protein [Hyphomicrobiaceae bacterium]|nr:DUF2865 domain-containing protein [Hyphomicrobiaceae bacterium]
MAVYATGMAIVILAMAYGVSLIGEALLQQSASSMAPPAPTSGHQQVPVVQSRVLGSQSFKEMLRSEQFWRTLRSDGGSRRSDRNMRWSPRPHDRAESYDWRNDDEFDDDAELATYRTVCVRLCDGYYWPISFATSPEYFARDAAACERSCRSPARLFVYRNPGQEPEHMVDLSGRRYVRLETAFRYRATYDASCRCRAEPWAQESLDRHRMYALEAERRKGNATAPTELSTLKEKFRSKREPTDWSVASRAEARSSEGPTMRLGAETRPRRGDGRSRPSPPVGDEWTHRVLRP